MNIDKILDSVRGLSPISYEKNLRRELNKALEELTSQAQDVEKLAAVQKQRDQVVKICDKFEACCDEMSSSLKASELGQLNKVKKEFAKFKKQT